MTNKSKAILTANTAGDLSETLNQVKGGFSVHRVPVDAVHDWSLADGALQHQSGGFFSVAGVLDQGSGESSVLLYQPQAAVTGLLASKINGQLHFLLQARAEPGCLGEAQYGPTVQSTPANYMQVHGGAQTPYVEYFIKQHGLLSPIDDTTQLDLGLRYLHKSKRSILTQTSDALETSAGFVWANVESLRQAVLVDAFLNIDLRSILSIAPWSATSTDGAMTPASSRVCKSLDADVRAETIGHLMAELGAVKRKPLSFVGLQDLPNWQRSTWGWREKEPVQGFEVNFFETTARHREKGKWIQPLVNSQGEGRVVLACAERCGLLEFFVRVMPEIGLTNAAAIGPSFLQYPGAQLQQPSWLDSASVASETLESDEGGRFYRDVSRYQIVRLDDADGLPSDGHWLRLSELKQLLRMSNVCTIQLRGIVSQLLGRVDL